MFSGKYKDRIGKIDKSNEQVWRTALSLGYKYGPLTEEQWETVEKKLAENMQQVRTVYAHNDQMAQLLGSGEIWIGDSRRWQLSAGARPRVCRSTLPIPKKG